MWLFSLFPFIVCVLGRTLKNLFQFMFIALFFFYPPSFMCCLRSNTKKNHHSNSVKLVTPFPRVLFDLREPPLYPYQQALLSKQYHQPPSWKIADSPGTGENFVLILAVNSAGPTNIFLYFIFFSPPTPLSCNAIESWNESLSIRSPGEGEGTCCFAEWGLLLSARLLCLTCGVVPTLLV